MSIYGSLDAPSDWTHTDECAKQDGRSSAGPTLCDCGRPDAPLKYQGSHMLPSESDERDGWVDIAAIGKHVRYWRDNPNGSVSSEPEGYEPFLRFGVNGETVVLTRRNAAQIAKTLAWFLHETNGAQETSP
jgi:hypothetical protein